MTWNPITAYFSWRSAERAADRALVAEAVGMLRTAFDAQRAQSEAFKVFLEGFRVAGPPEERPWNEDADNVKWLVEHGKMPEEFATLPVPQQLQAFINKLDTFHIDA